MIARRPGTCPICRGKISVGDRIKRRRVQAMGIEQWVRVHEYCAAELLAPPLSRRRRDLDYDP